MSSIFSKQIIQWYLQNKRDLPWRETNEPYTIWLSEILLQQTRVEQGLPYFNKFIDRYPNLKSFSEASEDEILKMWQGLGYYSRARNMMSCAKTIMETFDGNFPDNYKELLKLKGIGKYTAAAIASFCFKEPVSVVDGNVYRVLSRVFGMEDDLSDNQTYNVFYEKSQELIDTKRPELFNQAMMEFGALHCTPRNPDCDGCIFSDTCIAKKQEIQDVLPIKSNRIKKRKRFFDYYIISHDSKILINKRPKGDIWNGLYDFLLIENEQQNSPEDSNDFKLGEIDLKLVSSSKEYKHILTHQFIFARFFQLKVNSYIDFQVIKNDYSMIEVDVNTIINYPVPILIDNFLKNDYF